MGSQKVEMVVFLLQLLFPSVGLTCFPFQLMGDALL